MYFVYECIVFEGYKNIKKKEWILFNKSFYIKVFIINLELCNYMYIKIILIIKKIICVI